MEERRSGISQRISPGLEPLTDADDEALMGDTTTTGTTEPESAPDTGVKRGTRIGWWW
jgi:hypothetical protein